MSVTLSRVVCVWLHTGRVSFVPGEVPASQTGLPEEPQLGTKPAAAHSGVDSVKTDGVLQQQHAAAATSVTFILLFLNELRKSD